MSEKYALLCDISLTLSTSENVERVVQMAVKRLADVVSFERASLVTLNECESTYRVRTVTEKRSDVAMVDLPEVPINVGLAGRCMQRARVTYVPEMQFTPSSAQDATDPGMTDGQLRSVLCLPLFVFSRCTGALMLGAGSVNAFSPGDIQLVRQVAGHLAIALTRSQATLTHEPSPN